MMYHFINIFQKSNQIHQLRTAVVSILRGNYYTRIVLCIVYPWANLPICSTDIPDIPTFFISQENILGYEYYHKTHGDNKTTH